MQTLNEVTSNTLGKFYFKIGWYNPAVMGQINSVKDGSIPTHEPLANVKDTDAEDESKVIKEKVRCVKTRIDMLIEDCLNYKDGSQSEASEQCESPEDQNNDLNEDSKVNEKLNEVVNVKTENSDETQVAQDTDKVTVSSVDCCSEDDLDKVKDSDSEKKENKLDLADIIKDSVNTELTLTQLKQIQQRTITTFNSFIDKVLDNSLNKEFTEEKTSTNKSNILKLCSDSMIPNVEASTEKKDSSGPPKNKSEEPVNNNNSNNSNSKKDQKEKTITLKEHIERFLEISFREEILEDDHKQPETKVTLPENFNAQGLVNSMITQGIQINQLLTKGNSNSPTGKTNSLKEDNKQRGRILKVNETRQPTMNSQGQKSPSIRSYCDNNERRSGHEVPSFKMADHRMREHSDPRMREQSDARMREHADPRMRENSDARMREHCDARMREHTDARMREHSDARMREHTDARMREHYLNTTKGDSGQRMGAHPGFRMDDVMDRNRELQAKMAFDMGTAARPPGHMSSFFRPQHLQMENSPYLHPGYGPRMQLSPGGREMKYPVVGRDGKMHPRDCGCPYCVQMAQQCKNLDLPTPEHHNGKHSPLVPQALYDHSMAVQASMSGHLREVPVSMMKPMSELPPGMAGYHGMHKLMSQNPTVPASKGYSAAAHPEELPPHAMMPGRRPGLHEPSSYYYLPRPGSGEELSPAECAAIRSGKRSPYQIRPSSLPSQDPSSRPGSGYKMNESEYVRSSDSLSGASDCSNEAPLDLTVKKPKPDLMRNRSASSGSNVRKINPSLTFIKHLESSVDRHWQELSSSPPPSSNVQPQITINNSTTPNNSRNHSHLYPRRSPNESPPSGMVPMLSNRQLRSPHFMGGITVGQPLVDMKPQVTPKQPENQFNNTHQTGTSNNMSKSHSQQGFPGNQSTVDSNSKRNQSNNVSKHEPIQNIIGHNDPNDILYLICRLCTQTYGSPYGFRKHFRNQHGFEPRAEHTIVQTISATKTALHVPQPPTVQGMANFQESQKCRKSMTPDDVGSEGSKTSRSGSVGNRDSPSSLGDSRSVAGSEESDRCDTENNETKFLQCPECGKTFQLNDFGSYKRHCRQHGSVKLNGPFTCSDCHLPFPDQKLLREHYILHVNEGQHGMKQEKIIGEGINVKSERPMTRFYTCDKCDIQFDNMDSYTNHVNRHSFDSQGPKTEISNTVKTEQKVTLPNEPGKTSPSTVSSSASITIQAAESMTSLACPDSSWDNVAKVVATSGKADAVSSERRDSGNSNASDSSEQVSSGKNENQSGSNSPSVSCYRQKSVEFESDTSEERLLGNEEFVYKHKKFFHHRKRANSNISVDASEPKQTKFSSDASNSSMDDISCNSSGVTNTSVSESVNTSSSKPLDSENGKAQSVAVEKSTKTEARHTSLPFVLDRTIRSQRKS
ncbi:methyltransferase [Mactra antiquata]